MEEEISPGINMTIDLDAQTIWIHQKDKRGLRFTFDSPITIGDVAKVKNSILKLITK